MTVNELLLFGQSKCSSEEDKHALYWLLLEILDYSSSDYYLNLNNEVNEEVTNKYLSYVKRYLEESIPVQQLVGHSYFYNRKFYVNENTLIPRVETEELVFKTINYIKETFTEVSNLKVLDLATGSGCIGITIKKELGCDVTISDISQDALEIAKKNADLHEVSINIIASDWFNDINDKYDVVISNPPYIPISEKLEQKVLKEPYNALYSGVDGTDSYEVILSQISNNLNSKFIVAFEHHYLQSKLIANLIANSIKSDKILQEKDLSNKDRFTFIFGK